MEFRSGSDTTGLAVLLAIGLGASGWAGKVMLNSTKTFVESERRHASEAAEVQHQNERRAKFLQEITEKHKKPKNESMVR